MADAALDPVTSVLSFGTGALGKITWFIAAFFVIGLIGIVVYLVFLKDRPKNSAKELFNKQFEGAKHWGGFNSPKTLGLVTMLGEDTKDTPINQIHYQPSGKIIGVNLMGILTSKDDLIKQSGGKTDGGTAAVKTAKEENKPNDRLWVQFAVERVIGNFPMRRTKNGLVYCKPNQIINVNSTDNIVRVRGLGFAPLGEYEIVIDEQFKLNYNQLFADTEELIGKEITLSGWSSLGKIVEEAISSDSRYRKDAAIEGIKILQKPEGTEGVKLA